MAAKGGPAALLRDAAPTGAAPQDEDFDGMASKRANSASPGFMVAVSLRGGDDRSQRARMTVLQAEERRVASVTLQQVVMTAALDDLAALDHQDGVGMHDGVQ